MGTTINQNFSYARSLLEANLNPILIIDKDNTITDMNHAFLNFTTQKKGTVLGTSCCDYFTDAQAVKMACKKIFDKGSIANHELTIMNHEKKDFSFDGFVYKDELGSILGAILVARDISKQKKAEYELTASRKKAEKATQIAQQALKSKQQFLSNMSHEIRTPMNAIIGFTKIILKTDLTPKQKEYITAIKQSGNALIVLINDILDLAKVNSGKMVFEKIPFEMDTAILAMLNLFKTKIQEKNLILITEYDKKIPKVLLGDPARLHQIILNLVSNAVKFTQKGSITVRLKLLSQDAQNVAIEFAIIDTGIGIEKNKINTIFENFQQVYSLNSRLYGGTGLGLAIVKQLVEAQGGNINVESKVSEGTTFSFTLMFGKTNEKIVLEDEIILFDDKINHLKVLIVEDILLNQLLIKTILDDFGFTNDIVANGKLALEILKTNTYDVILMDLQMPEMNGFEATKHIRNILKLETPIIALTADVTTVDIVKCKVAGMDDYIAKPIDESLLYNKIVRLVKSVNKRNKRIKNIIQKHEYTDLSYLKQITEGNLKLMEEIIEAYLEETPSILLEISGAIEQNDWNVLQQELHKIIPSFFIMGIPYDIETLNQKINEQKKNLKVTQEIHTLVSNLEKTCRYAFDELKIELEMIKEITKKT